jgi:hypothetical protein
MKIDWEITWHGNYMGYMFFDACFPIFAVQPYNLTKCWCFKWLNHLKSKTYISNICVNTSIFELFVYRLIIVTLWYYKWPFSIAMSDITRGYFQHHILHPQDRLDRFYRRIRRRIFCGLWRNLTMLSLVASGRLAWFTLWLTLENHHF